MKYVCQNQVFCQIVCYLAELFRQIVCYLVELFRQIAFPPKKFKFVWGYPYFGRPKLVTNQK